MEHRRTHMRMLWVHACMCVHMCVCARVCMCVPTGCPYVLTRTSMLTCSTPATAAMDHHMLRLTASVQCSQRLPSRASGCRWKAFM